MEHWAWQMMPPFNCNVIQSFLQDLSLHSAFEALPASSTEAVSQLRATKWTHSPLWKDFILSLLPEDSLTKLKKGLFCSIEWFFFHSLF